MVKRLRDLFWEDPLKWSTSKYEMANTNCPIIIGQPIKSISDAPKQFFDCPLYQWENDEQLNNSILHAIVKASLEFGHLYNFTTLNNKKINSIIEQLSSDEKYFCPKLIVWQNSKEMINLYHLIGDTNIGIQVNVNIVKPILILTPAPEDFGLICYKEYKPENSRIYIDGKELGFFILAKNVAIIEFSEFIP